MLYRRHRAEFHLLLWTAILAILTTAILLVRPLSNQEINPRSSLELRVADQGGRMRVDWDANSPVIQTAQGATLEVRDGGVFNRYPVESNILRSGGLDYVRRSDDVLLILTLYHDGRPGVQSSVLRIAPLDTQLATTPKREGEDVRSRRP